MLLVLCLTWYLCHSGFGKKAAPQTVQVETLNAPSVQMIMGV